MMTDIPLDVVKPTLYDLDMIGNTTFVQPIYTMGQQAVKVCRFADSKRTGEVTIQHAIHNLPNNPKHTQPPSQTICGNYAVIPETNKARQYAITIVT